MRAKTAWGRAAAAWSLGILLGCLGGDAFLCESDEVCQQDGVSGLCQPSGYCSFPDEECDSGQRYGEHAGGSVAGTCVEPEGLTGDTGASEDGPPTTGPGTSTGVTTLTTLPPTTADDGPTTTDPVDDSDTGSTGPSTTDVGDDAPPATTGPVGMEVCWDDEFDDGVLGPEWCPYTDPGVAVDEPDGHLRFTFVPTDWNPKGTDGGGWSSLCEWFPLLGAEAATQLVAVPQVSSYTESLIEMGNHELRLGMGVLGGELYAFVYDGMVYSGVAFQPYMPDAHRWLRILGTDEGYVAEASPDGMAWANVYTLPTDLGGAEGWATLGAWAEMVPLGPDEATFERFHLCWLQG